MIKGVGVAGVKRRHPTAFERAAALSSPAATDQRTASGNI